MKIPTNCLPAQKIVSLALLALISSTGVHAQRTAAPVDKRAPEEKPRATAVSESDVVLMTPFVVSSDRDNGYAATDTLAGTRLRTELKDVGAAIGVITGQFMEDTGSVNAKDVLVYATNAEVGGIGGNTSGVTLTATSSSNTGIFDSPSQATRVRGVSSADLMRDFFATSIPMDTYNTERVDISRGANAILFGLGSPAGIINNQLKTADPRTRKYRVQATLGSYGSYRGVFDFNQPIISKELAVRVVGLEDKRYYQQEPAYERDRRLFATADWEKTFFQNGLTQLQVSYEKGRQNSNRPRVTPPQDGLTMWFDPAALNKWSYDGPTSNAVRTNAALYPAYLTWPGRWMNAGTLGSIFENPDSSTQALSRVAGYKSAAGPDLNVWGPTSWASAGAFNNFIGNQRFFAANGLPSTTVPLTGLWRQQEILDSSAYDFYNQLLDGPNKWERADFDAVNAVLRQTFFRNKLGVELAYDRQNFDRASFQPFFFEGASILVDMMQTNFDGTPNKNYGRPYVASDSGGNEAENDRDAMRATVFGELDFRQNSRWTRYLGRHIFTGLLSRQKEESFSRGFGGYAYDYADLNPYLTTPLATYAGYGVVRYLGDSIANLSSPAGAHIGNLKAVQDPARNASSQYWDDKNKRWVTITPTLYNYVDDIDKLYNSAAKTRSDTKSWAFIWQSYLLNDKLVGMLGWRHDQYKQYNSSAAIKAPTGQVLPYDPSWVMPESTSIPVFEKTSLSWSVVGHTPDFVKKWLPRGTDFSVFYNRSGNFKPSGVGADPYGNVFDPPEGTTRDVGVRLALMDNKLSIRINNYKTAMQNDTTWVVNDYWYGNDFTRFLNGLRQSNTPEWVINKWFGFQPSDPRYLQPRASWTSQPTVLNPSLTSAEATARTAWFNARTPEEWLANSLVDQDLVKAWALSQNASKSWIAGTRPPNIRNVADIVSTGWEGEITYNPTKSWRMILNVAKQEANRSNVGSDMTAFVAKNLPLWTDGNGVIAKNMREVDGFEDVTHFGNFSTTLGTQGMKNIYIPYLGFAASDNTNVNELRKWRANFVTNYDFQNGRLKGFSIGGAVRWQDKICIGYQPKMVTTSVGNVWVVDRDKPFYGPAETNYDAWLRYGRPIMRGKVRWSVQLNVRDLFASKALIPVAIQPDGTIASARIPQANRWTLTNSFDF
ncbi:MAG: hypothetical protein KBA71_08575 [Opitutaceae bacterium]|nr:hypothetical protein [Opitutaceae bacterium]